VYVVYISFNGITLKSHAGILGRVCYGSLTEYVRRCEYCWVLSGSINIYQLADCLVIETSSQHTCTVCLCRCGGRTMHHCTTVLLISGKDSMLLLQSCGECFLNIIHSRSLMPLSVIWTESPVSAHHVE